MSGAAGPRCRCDRQLGRHPRAAMVAALSAALPSRPADRILAVADAVLVVGGAGRRRRPRSRPVAADRWRCSSSAPLPCAAPAAPGTTSPIAISMRKVERTRSRPIPAGQVSVPQAVGVSGRAGADRTCGAAAIQPLRGRDRHRLARHRRGLSVHEADHLVAADRAGPGVLLGRADGICGDARADRCDGACALRRLDRLGDRLRHHLCASGRRGRRADRHQIDRAACSARARVRRWWCSTGWRWS